MRLSKSVTEPATVAAIIAGEFVGELSALFRSIGGVVIVMVDTRAADVVDIDFYF